MTRVRIDRPSGGNVIAVPRGTTTTLLLRGRYQNDDDPAVAVDVAVRGQSHPAAVDVATRTWQVVIPLESPSRVLTRATMQARVRDAAGQWTVRSLRSAWLLLIARDPQHDPEYVFSGTVVDTRGNPLPGLLVQAFDLDRRSRADALGHAISDDGGAVAIRCRESDFAESAGEGGPDVKFVVSGAGTTFPAELVGRRGNWIPAAREDEPPFVLRVNGVNGAALTAEIRAKWHALGGSHGFLGLPLGDTQPVGGTTARQSHFASGSIYWTPDFGAAVVYGLIRERWRALGAEGSWLGLPVSDELDDPAAPGARASVFEHGVVRWRPGQAAAVEGPHDFARLHGQMRAQVLARYFAIGPTGRRNLPSFFHLLKEPVQAATSGADRLTADLARWQIERPHGENPFLYGVNLIAMLAVEQQAGHAESGAALRDWLQTVRSLCTWQTVGPEGDARLPQRWDAGGFLDAKGESHGFIALDQAYAGALPASDPHHYAHRSPETLTALLGPRAAEQYSQNYEHAYAYRYRVWELSMDELVGLVTSYWLIANLSTDPALTAEVRTQATWVGNYLADHGYLLVRPMGGLSWRGATEMLPGMEHPISRALANAAGAPAPFTARVSMSRALEIAGYWDQLKDPVANWRALAWTATLAAVGTSPVALAAGLNLNTFSLAFSGQLLSPDTLGAAGALYLHRDVFDTSGKNLDAGPALAWLLRDSGAKGRLYLNLTTAMAAVADLTGLNKPWAVAFPGTLCLTGIDDPDPTVRSAFAAWYSIRRANPQLETKGVGSQTLWVDAVAVLLAGTDAAAEARLVARLDRAVVELFRDCYFDPVLPTGWHEGDKLEPHEYVLMPYYVYGAQPKAPYGVLDFLAAHALATWHSSRRAGGTPVVTPRFPAALTLGTMQDWPAPTIPAHCLAAFGPGGIPIEAIHGAQPTADERQHGVPLRFGVPRRRAVPPPWPAATQLLCDVTVNVPATQTGEVATGVTLHPGMEYSIEATGTIWAGRLLDPQHGPEGLPRPVRDARWPLHVGIDPSANEFCLLGRLNGWFRIGDRLGRRRWRLTEARSLFLRVNDGLAVHGTGQYTARIRVFGPPGQTWSPPVHQAPRPLDDQSVIRTSAPRDVIEVTVVPGAAAPDTVEYVLKVAAGLATPKDLTTINVAPPRRALVTGTVREAGFSLSAIEQSIGTLLLRSQAGLVMADRRVLGGLASVPLGSRVTLDWVMD